MKNTVTSDSTETRIPWSRAGNSLFHSLLIRSFAHFAQDKWATVSDSLRSLRGNEYMSDSLKNFGKKKSKILFFSMFYIQIFEQRWVKLTDVLESAESSSEMFWTALSQAQRCSGQRWVKLRDVLDSAESSSEMFWKAPNQAQRCSGQRLVNLRDVLDSPESSLELFWTALSQPQRLSGKHWVKLRDVQDSALELQTG